MTNPNVTRGTKRGWTMKVRLHRDDLAEILDALSDMRDPFGDEASELEFRLSRLLQKGDKEMADKAWLEGETKRGLGPSARRVLDREAGR